MESVGRLARHIVKLSKSPSKDCTGREVFDGRVLVFGALKRGVHIWGVFSQIFRGKKKKERNE